MNKSFLIGLIAVIIAVSGCSLFSPDKDAEQIARANSQMQAFLSDYPNADVTSTYYTPEESAEALTKIEEMCNRKFTARELYLVMATDLDSGASVTVWINAKDNRVICLYKKGIPSAKETANITLPINTSMLNETSAYNITEEGNVSVSNESISSNYTLPVNETFDYNYTNASSSYNYTQPVNLSYSNQTFVYNATNQTTQYNSTNYTSGTGNHSGNGTG